MNHLMCSCFPRKWKYLTHGCSTLCCWTRKMDALRCLHNWRGNHSQTENRQRVNMLQKLLVLALTLPHGLDWVFQHAFYSITVLKRDMWGKGKRKYKALTITLTCWHCVFPVMLNPHHRSHIIKTMRIYGKVIIAMVAYQVRGRSVTLLNYLRALIVCTLSKY